MSFQCEPISHQPRIKGPFPYVGNEIPIRLTSRGARSEFAGLVIALVIMVRCGEKFALGGVPYQMIYPRFHSLSNSDNAIFLPHKFLAGIRSFASHIG